MLNFYSLNKIFFLFLQYLSISLLLFSPLAYSNEKVTLQLKWKHQFQFAGYYAAQQMGFYDDAGFEVDIKERDAEQSPLHAVLEGKADFGVSDSSVILHRMRGKPVVVLAAIFQHSPLVLLTRANDNLLGPYELKGKRVMYQKGIDDAVITGMLHQLGLSNKHIIHVPQTFDYKALLNGDVDAMSAYITNEPYLYKQHGMKVHAIDPLNYGIDFYDDMLFSHEDPVQSNPQRAQRFLHASLKGWTYALAHPNEVIGWIKSEYGSEKSIEHLQFEAAQTEKRILPQWVEVGDTSISRFQRIANIYKELGQAPKRASFKGVTLNEYLDNNEDMPYWVKFVIVAGMLSLCLAIVFLMFARHFRNLVLQRTAELDQANTELARYIRIVDQYVISSQTDIKGLITKVSSAFSRTTGYSSNELIGRSHSIVRHEDTDSETFEAMWSELKQGNVWSGICKNQKKDGSDYWLEFNIDPIVDQNKKTIGYLSVGQDITDKKRIEHLSITDKLTGLYNRLHLDTVLENEVKRISRYGGSLSVILCDIDYFKSVNDKYGHLQGDNVLSSIAHLLKNNSRSTDVVGRWGGEEFLIVCPNTTLASATLVAEKLRETISSFEFPVIGVQTCSFGVAEATEKCLVTDIVSAADIALYEAKKSGRNKVENESADCNGEKKI